MVCKIKMNIFEFMKFSLASILMKKGSFMNFQFDFLY